MSAPGGFIMVPISTKFYKNNSKFVKYMGDPGFAKRFEAMILVFAGLLALLPSAIGVAEYTERNDKSDTSKHSLYVAQAFILSVAAIVTFIGIYTFFDSFQKPKMGLVQAPPPRTY